MNHIKQQAECWIKVCDLLEAHNPSLFENPNETGFECVKREILRLQAQDCVKENNPC